MRQKNARYQTIALGEIFPTAYNFLLVVNIRRAEGGRYIQRTHIVNCLSFPSDRLHAGLKLSKFLYLSQKRQTHVFRCKSAREIEWC